MKDNAFQFVARTLLRYGDGRTGWRVDARTHAELMSELEDLLRVTGRPLLVTAPLQPLFFGVPIGVYGSDDSLVYPEP